MKDLMYDFVSSIRPNPIGGSCYDCSYCYIHGKKGMKTRFPNMRKKYSGRFRLYPKVLQLKFKKDLIFFCDCIDWLHENMSITIILKIIEWIKKSPNANFLSVTKNPAKYLDIIDFIPPNLILGCTIESDINYPYYSNAPSQNNRLRNMIELYQKTDNPLFLSIEPIMKFRFDSFYDQIEQISPFYGIAIGYDNHNNKLDEPKLKDTMSLRNYLIRTGFKVIDKTLKKAWWE